MVATQIRPAELSDLEHLWMIRYLNDIAGAESIPEVGPIPPFLDHVRATGELLVAEKNGEVIAYAGVIDRGGVAFLTDLFAHPDHQSSGVGNRLLTTLFSGRRETRCTLASTDPRAMALYTRFGMSPRWPNLLLEAPATALTIESSSPLELVEVIELDPGMISFDAAFGGRNREPDFGFWKEKEGGHSFWVMSGNRRCGCAVVRMRAGRLWHPEAITVGPITVEDPAESRTVVNAVIQWAVEQGSYVEVAVPGPHPALPSLLSVGFRIVYVETFCSGEAFAPDPRRYIGSGGDLF